MPQTHLAARRQDVLAEVLTHVDAQHDLLILRAPPGSGKTYVTLRGAVLAHHRGQRVAVATQTNAQADDLCARIGREFPGVPVVRFAAADYDGADLPASVTWATKTNELPSGACIVVAVTAKWVCSDVPIAYDVVFVDEAWQMSWAEFMVMGTKLAPRFVLVGDPGQIEPVVSIDVARWQTSARPPHLAAPAVLSRERTLPARWLSLPVTTRLPHDSVELVRSFYDFEFDSWASPGERKLLVGAARGRREKGADEAIDLLTQGSIAMLSLPTPENWVAESEDAEVAAAAASVARRLLERGARAQMSRGEAARAIRAEDIGICATHRVMNSRIAAALGDLAGAVRVDTPERWQGLERKVMIAVHPLSGVTDPSAFDLSTGRLCVMASRHQVGLVLVGRDHIEDTLEEYFPVADQALGREDACGRGHAQHQRVMAWLRAEQRVVSG